MPYYEYQCDDCGLFSQQRRMSEAGKNRALPRLSATGASFGVSTVSGDHETAYPYRPRT